MAHCHGLPDLGAVVEASPRWCQRFAAVRRLVSLDSATLPNNSRNVYTRAGTNTTRVSGSPDNLRRETIIG